jgi:hypothetical protein
MVNGTIADGSGVATDSAVGKGSSGDGGPIVTAEFAGESGAIDLTDPEDWLLAIGDRDVA